MQKGLLTLFTDGLPLEGPELAKESTGCEGPTSDIFA